SKPHCGSSPPKESRDGAFWSNTATTPRVIKRYDAAAGIWKETDMASFLPTPVERWHPDLDEALAAKLALPSRSAGQHGKPAYLAYVVLAALLDVTPPRIRATIETFDSFGRRRAKRRRPAP